MLLSVRVYVCNSFWTSRYHRERRPYLGPRCTRNIYLLHFWSVPMFLFLFKVTLNMSGPGARTLGWIGVMETQSRVQKRWCHQMRNVVRPKAWVGWPLGRLDQWAGPRPDPPLSRWHNLSCCGFCWYPHWYRRYLHWHCRYPHWHCNAHQETQVLFWMT